MTAPLTRKQLAFARVVKARLVAAGDPMAAEAYAEGRGATWSTTPEVLDVLKAATTAVTTADAASLPAERILAAEFLELVRARSITGRMDLRRVPLNVMMIGATISPSAGWVGENMPAPLSAAGLASFSLQPFKLRSDVVLTSELVRASTPQADVLMAHEMAAALAAAEDRRFIDPLYPAVEDVQPASVTSGLSANTSAGTSAANILADLESIFDTFDGSDGSLDSAVLLLHPKSARSLAKLQGSSGGNLFPSIGVRGGTVWGMPCLVSSALEHAGSPGERFAAVVDPQRVLYAEEPIIEVEVGRHVSMQMDDAPSSGASTQISLWQQGLVAMRATRWVTWKTAGTASAVLVGMAW